MKEILLGASKGEGIFSGRTSLKRQDYHSGIWKKREYAGAILISALVTVFGAWFFYRSIWAAPLLLPVGVIFFLRLRERKKQHRKEELTAEFRECILAVSALLEAGYSVERAFLECEGDMAVMYGRNALICEELRMIRRGMQINITLEELLTNFGARSECEEIIQFAEIFAIAKRSGGNMVEIIGGSAELIGKKADMRQQLNALLGGRRMELGIMEAMPFAILLYIGLANPGYFDVLYQGISGRLIMTGCLAVYIGALVLGEAVMERLQRNLE